MASIPYLVISPTTLLSFIFLIKKIPEIIAKPEKDWQKVSVDVLIPAYNEQQKICACLASLKAQTLAPRKILLIDDNSQDKTILYAEKFSKEIDLHLEIIPRKKQEGKTPSLRFITQHSNADVIFVLDADTILASDNYIARTVEELYKNVEIASSCGFVLPYTTSDNSDVLKKYKKLEDFCNKHPQANLYTNLSRLKRIEYGLTNMYRYCLYTFLQRYVYQAEMRFCGSLINPVGCAVAYKREYLSELFEQYTPILGDNLTTSEDIFIGFSFCDKGYRNVISLDIQANSVEPPINRLHKQIFLWSSSFLQSCYYFSDLVKTPFKAFRRLRKTNKSKNFNEPLGPEYTKKYGRKIGLFIFTGLLEKICFPMVILLLMLFQLWRPLIITCIAETLVMTYINSMVVPKRSIMLNIFLNLTITPIRYFYLMYDLIVMTRFFIDISFKKKLNWRK